MGTATWNRGKRRSFPGVRYCQSPAAGRWQTEGRGGEGGGGGSCCVCIGNDIGEVVESTGYA